MGKRILIAGPYRVASTWIYNIARVAAMEEDDAVQCGVLGYNFARLDELGSASFVVKFHGYSEEVEAEATHVLTSIRDPLTICASLVRKDRCSIDKAMYDASLSVEWYEKWASSPKCCFDGRYEEMMKDKESTARQVLEAIGSNSDPIAVYRQVESMGHGSSINPITAFHPNHITSGDPYSCNPLKPGEAARIRAAFEGFRKQHGYATETTL